MTSWTGGLQPRMLTFRSRMFSGRTAPAMPSTSTSPPLSRMCTWPVGISPTSPFPNAPSRSGRALLLFPSAGGRGSSTASLADFGSHPLGRLAGPVHGRSDRRLARGAGPLRAGSRMKTPEWLVHVVYYCQACGERRFGPPSRGRNASSLLHPAASVAISMGENPDCCRADRGSAGFRAH
jgi:hypothetical protein